MLGHKMYQTLASRFPETYCTIRSSETDPSIELLRRESVIQDVDAADFNGLSTLLNDLGPSVVVNCVGVIKQRKAADKPIPSITINSLLPHELAAICEEMGTRLIHFSTDCVFSGAKGAYREDDPSDAQDLYGMTKVLGEVAEPPSLTLRSSIIGRELGHRSSLLEWFLAQEGRKVKGFRRALYSGLTTTRMAHLVGDLIQNHPDLSGLYHVAGPWISKYELLCLARDTFGVKIEIVPDDEIIIDRTLVADRFESATGYRPPTWQEMLSEVASDPTPYESWRP